MPNGIKVLPTKNASATATIITSTAVIGLVGSASGFKYTPNLDHGFFSEGEGTVYPQSLNLSCEFSCMHTHPLGYGPDGELRNKIGSFPYNAGVTPEEIKAQKKLQPASRLDLTNKSKFKNVAKIMLAASGPLQKKSALRAVLTTIKERKK